MRREMSALCLSTPIAHRMVEKTHKLERVVFVHFAVERLVDIEPMLTVPAEGGPIRISLTGIAVSEW